MAADHNCPTRSVRTQTSHCNALATTPYLPHSPQASCRLMDQLAVVVFRDKDMLIKAQIMQGPQHARLTHIMHSSSISRSSLLLRSCNSNGSARNAYDQHHRK